MKGQITWNVIECMNCCNHSLMIYDIVYPREVYFYDRKSSKKSYEYYKKKFGMEGQIPWKLCK